MKKLNHKGVIHHLVLIVIVAAVLVGSGFAGYRVYKSRKSASAETSSNNLISAGLRNSCAIRFGALYCWGFGSDGQLGVAGRTTDSYVPVMVSYMNAGVTSVSNGDLHSCVIKSGALFCWGVNLFGQLGDGTKTGRAIPNPVQSLSNSVIAVSSSEFNNCAIKQNNILKKSGALYCWGNNVDFTNSDKVSPVLIWPSGITDISAGKTHSCAINLGALLCWGNNNWGQLGDGGTTNRSLPTTLSMPTGYRAVSVGASYTCAINNLSYTNGLECWGSNDSGQLGDGTLKSRSTPTLVQGMSSGVTDISTYYSTTCAVKSGALYCWGSNDSGQLGDGTLNSRSTPTLVQGMSSLVTSVTVGRKHTCAMRYGAQYCWGSNSSGQLGDGTNINRLTPVLVK